MSTELTEKYAEIAMVKENFLKKISKLNHEQLNRIPANGGWSAGQVLYHVAFAESGTILVIQKNLAENKVRLSSDLMSVVRNVMLVLTLKSPLKFKAPKVVSKVPETTTYDELKTYFDKNSVAFKKILEQLPAELEDKFIFKHPIGGLFNITQTLNFTREHYLHHERQLDASLK
jgi:uncharacterized damage-inducible protein DinB